MSERRNELTRIAARLFAERGYHGTSIGDLARAMGVQKGSLYHHIDTKADLLWEVAREGAAAFHGGLDAIPERLGRARLPRRAARNPRAAAGDREDPARTARAPRRRRRPARPRDGLRQGVDG